jgi:hypothetical protein
MRAESVLKQRNYKFSDIRFFVENVVSVIPRTYYINCRHAFAYFRNWFLENEIEN